MTKIMKIEGTKRPGIPVSTWRELRLRRRDPVDHLRTGVARGWFAAPT